MSAVDVHAVVTGRADAPVVVLSNSLGSTHRMWDTQLADLSIDSLDVVELLCLIDEEFDVRLEQGRFEELGTVGNLAETIARATEAAPGARERRS